MYLTHSDHNYNLLLHLAAKEMYTYQIFYHKYNVPTTFLLQKQYIPTTCWSQIQCIYPILIANTIYIPHFDHKYSVPSTPWPQIYHIYHFLTANIICLPHFDCKYNIFNHILTANAKYKPNLTVNTMYLPHL